MPTDKVPPLTGLVLRTSNPGQVKAPTTPKTIGLLSLLRLEWSLRAVEALVPAITSPLILNLPATRDDNNFGESFLELTLTLPEKILDGPIGTEFSPFSLTMPTDLVAGPIGDGPLITPLSTPEEIVEEGRIRPSANKPVPAVFHQARRQRYIYDW